MPFLWNSLIFSWSWLKTGREFFDFHFYKVFSAKNRLIPAQRIYKNEHWLSVLPTLTFASLNHIFAAKNRTTSNKSMHNRLEWKKTFTCCYGLKTDNTKLHPNDNKMSLRRFGRKSKMLKRNPRLSNRWIHSTPYDQLFVDQSEPSYGTKLGRAFKTRKLDSEWTTDHISSFAVIKAN